MTSFSIYWRCVCTIEHYQSTIKWHGFHSHISFWDCRFYSLRKIEAQMDMPISNLKINFARDRGIEPLSKLIIKNARLEFLVLTVVSCTSTEKSNTDKKHDWKQKHILSNNRWIILSDFIWFLLLNDYSFLN